MPGGSLSCERKMTANLKQTKCIQEPIDGGTVETVSIPVLTIVVISLYIHPFGQILIKANRKESSRMRPPGFRVFEVRISV
ncbi:MAG TPA: hypothetical protein GX728_04485 [Clostridiaceae bacterium]|nr:hypothetical protein [Clostridiaceae bacterium]